MADRSCWSRATVIEIGDIPDGQAVEYLIKNGVAEDQAKSAVASLTGGRFSLLNNFIVANRAGIKYEQMMEKKDSVLEARLADLEGVRTNAKYLGWILCYERLFKFLVEHGRVGVGAARISIGMTKAQLDLLLQNSILAEHADGTYTFFDRHTSDWFCRDVGALIMC
jgi:hypothetical protein